MPKLPSLKVALGTFPTSFERYLQPTGFDHTLQAAAEKTQMVHNASVQNVDPDAIAAGELWSFVEKNKSTVCQRS